MGTHGARHATARASARPPGGQIDWRQSGRRPMDLTLADWPVARRLFTVIVAALLMGLVFGGLRVAAAENSASQFSRTQQLAKLGVQLVTAVNDLQNERDATLVDFLGGKNKPQLTNLQAKTKSDLVPVRRHWLGSWAADSPRPFRLPRPR